MKFRTIAVAGALSLFAGAFSSPVFAQAEQAECESKAVSKDGKPLAGAAKAASVKKCVTEAKVAQCEGKAVSKEGKPLAGAAKNSFMKKCEADARGG